jgi:hypothetical protein
LIERRWRPLASTSRGVLDDIDERDFFGWEEELR